MKIDVVHQDIWDFLRKLDPQSYAETVRIIELLGQRGYEIRMPYSKKVSKNIYELRIQSIQNVRVFYTFNRGQIFLLHAIIKKTQKLARKDLDVAVKREKWLH